jgi:hypothetical protein
MDPLSIVAGAIAVCQAADRLATLFASVKTYFAAPHEIDTLENEVGNVMIALNTLQSAASRLPSQGLPDLDRLVEACTVNTLELKGLVMKSYIKRADLRTSTRRRFHRMAWVWRKNKVQKIKQQLRDAQSALLLQVMGMSTQGSPDNPRPYPALYGASPFLKTSFCFFRLLKCNITPILLRKVVSHK